MAKTSPKPTDLQLGAEQGVDRTLFFRWTWNKGQTDHYEVWWEYSTGNKIKVGSKQTLIWFTGAEDNVKAEVGISTYTYPNNAKKVRVRVKPVAKQNDNNKPFWTCDYTKAVVYTVPTNASGVAGDSFPYGVTGLKVIVEKSSQYSLRALWKWTKAYTDFFQVQWFYSDGTNKGDAAKTRLWFLGSIDQVEYRTTGSNEYQSAFSAPQTSTKVMCRVIPISTVKEETDTLVRYQWRAKARDVYYNGFPAIQTPANADNPTDVKLHIQNGTTRTYYATWTWTYGNVDHYEVIWQYTTGVTNKEQTYYYDGQRGNVSVKESTYTMPDNATRVRFRVQPFAKESSSGGIPWKAEPSDFVYSKFTDIDDKNKVVTGVKLELERGSESTVVAQWNWAYASTTDHYEVEWLYTTGQQTPDKKSRIFFPGTTTTAEPLQKGGMSTYSPPANAASVHIKILPIAKASQWIAKKSNQCEFKMPSQITFNTTALAKAVNMHDIARQTGTNRTLVAEWEWDQANTDHYEIEWRYRIYTTINSDGVWVRESIKTTDSSEIRYDLYTPPDNTDHVMVKVRPIAKTKKVQGIETPYWNAKWCDYKGYILSAANEANALPPPVPQTPSVFINGTTLTASLNIYDAGAQIIEFEVIKDDSTSFRTERAKVVYNHAEIRIPIDIGGEYKVRARSLRPVVTSSIDAVLANATTANSERSVWSEFSEYVGTVPATPERIESHTIQTSQSVYIVWSEVTNITGYNIEYATNPEYFDKSDQVTSIDTNANHDRIIDGLESGNTYYFRVRAVNENGESGWSSIYSLVLGTRPSAPTTWSDTTRGVIGEEIYLYWTHNSEDKSSQQAAEIELTINGTTKTVNPPEFSDGSVPSYYIFNSVFTSLDTYIDDSDEEVIDGDDDPLQFASNDSYAEGSTVLWRVRTRGILDEWSPWSTQRTILLYSLPSVSLYVGDDPERNSKVYEITHYPIYIHAEAFPNVQKAVSYVVNIIANESYVTTDKYGERISIRDQQTVFNKYYNAESNTLDLTLTASDVNLDSDITYTLSVTVAMDSGLSGDNNWTFAARWDDAALTPDAEVTVNKKELCAYIRPFCITEAGEYIEGVLLSVYRIEYDGRYVPIAVDVPNGEATVVDPHPSLNYARYRIVSTNENTGELAFYDIPGVIVGETSIVLQWNEAWKSFDTNDGIVEGEYADLVSTGSTLKLPYNVEITDNTDIDVALNEYIGRSHPVSYYGTQLGVKGSWNAVIPRDDIQTLYALRRLAIYRGDVYVREPSGVGYWANINVSFSKRYSEMTIPVSLTVTRVEGGI